MLFVSPGDAPPASTQEAPTMTIWPTITEQSAFIPTKWGTYALEAAVSSHDEMCASIRAPYLHDRSIQPGRDTELVYRRKMKKLNVRLVDKNYAVKRAVMAICGAIRHGEAMTIGRINVMLSIRDRARAIYGCPEWSDDAEWAKVDTAINETMVQHVMLG